MPAASRWILASTFAAWLWMAAPVLREARLGPGEREAWRRDVRLVDPARVAASLASGDRRIVVLDVREPGEFAQYHIPTARNVPLKDVSAMDLGDCLQADLVIPCSLRDFRGFAAARLLEARGVPCVALLEGFGLEGWNDAAQLPLAGEQSGMNDAEVLRRLAP